MLRAFEVACPTCGYEVRGASSSSAVRELARRLETTGSEAQRIVIVRSFPIPNTKEDIFEFMVLAASNFDSDYYAAHLDVEDISDAWLAKVEQCYQKAKLLFGSHADFERIEEIYRRIKNECSEKEISIRRERKAERSAEERAESAALFRKSKLRTTLIVFLIISASFMLVSFTDGRIAAGVIAIAMFALFAVAFLMGSAVIKEIIKNMRLIPFILGLVLIVPFMVTFVSSDSSIAEWFKDTESIVWDRLDLGDKLPDYGETKATVVSNSYNSLKLRFYDQSKDDLKEYIEKCKGAGYTIDVENEQNGFTAYNADGYCLHLSWYESGGELTIDLKEPREAYTIIWPSTDLVKDVPVPEHLIGEVEYENESQYSLYLVGIEESYFDDYVSQCIANGFSIDYSRSKRYFRGENSKGVSITVEYEGFNTLYIRVTDY